MYCVVCVFFHYYLNFNATKGREELCASTPLCSETSGVHFHKLAHMVHCPIKTTQTFLAIYLHNLIMSPHRKPRSPLMIKCGNSWAVGGIRWWWRMLKRAFTEYSHQIMLSSWSRQALSLPHNATATSPRLEALLTHKPMGLALQWVCTVCCIADETLYSILLYSMHINTDATMLRWCCIFLCCTGYSVMLNTRRKVILTYGSFECFTTVYTLYSHSLGVLHWMKYIVWERVRWQLPLSPIMKSPLDRPYNYAALHNFSRCQ